MSGYDFLQYGRIGESNNGLGRFAEDYTLVLTSSPELLHFLTTLHKARKWVWHLVN